eukprot:TRINITY_DN6239_c0_g1_i1.p1 TRINITY_DN6239_c0_g1~~TRINITY_DN6239_c0_g1_i1.p1  ORF type:complete len:423 (+),score=80.31 TRINITY_DN6239_c0_g1_i1:121-1389(+)
MSSIQEISLSKIARKVNYEQLSISTDEIAYCYPMTYGGTNFLTTLCNVEAICDNKKNCTLIIPQDNIEVSGLKAIKHFYDNYSENLSRNIDTLNLLCRLMKPSKHNNGSLVFDCNENSIDVEMCSGKTFLVSEVKIVFGITAKSSKTGLRYYSNVRIIRMDIFDDIFDSTIQTENLPSIQEFRKMTISERMEFYYTTSFPDITSNNNQQELIEYGTFYSENGTILIKDSSQVSDNEELVHRPYGNPTKLEKFYLDTEGNYHYAVVLTFDITKFDINQETGKKFELVEMRNKFLQKAGNYTRDRQIDIRGFWYDIDYEFQPHANLHIVSNLQLPYIKVLFQKWYYDMGAYSVRHINEPIGWRIYGARNHHLRYEENEKTATVSSQSSKQYGKHLYSKYNTAEILKGRVYTPYTYEIKDIDELW